MSLPATDVPPSLPRNVKVLGATSLCNDIASEMVYPLLPRLLIEELGGDRRWLGLMEGLAETISSFLKLFAGGWSDRAGQRKGFVVVGYFLATVLRPLLAVASMPWQVLVIRVGDRIGKGIRTAPRDALIADSTPADQRGRAFGFHRAMDHLGAALGPMIAVLVLAAFPDGYRWLFALALLPGIFVMVALIFGLREPASAGSALKTPFSFSLRPFDGRFRFFLVTLVIFTLSNSSDLFLLERAREIGMGDLERSLLWGAFHVLKSVGNAYLGSVADRRSPRWMIATGWCVYALIYLCFAWVAESWQVWLLFGGYALYFAFTEPAEKKLVVDLAGEAHKGLAFGWFHFAVALTIFPASLLFGILYHSWGATVAFSSGAVLALFAAGLILLIPSPGSIKPNSPGQ